MDNKLAKEMTKASWPGFSFLKNKYCISYTRCRDSSGPFLCSTHMVILGKRQLRNACGNFSGLSWISINIFTWVKCIKKRKDGFPTKFWRLSNRVGFFFSFHKGHDLLCFTAVLLHNVFQWFFNEVPGLIGLVVWLMILCGKRLLTLKEIKML